MTDITNNLQTVRKRVAAAAVATGRDPSEVMLLAVSKGQPMSAIRRAVAAGQRDFGENYLQDAIAKIDGLANPDLSWHFIGHLQSNKTREVAARFAWVHTVDSVRIARRLSDQRPPEAAPLNICLQVRIGDETTKFGVQPGQARELAAAVKPLGGVRLRGLMCIPPPAPDPTTQRAQFARLRTLYETLRDDGFEMDTLSMGMSADLEAAIAEGATIVRVGTAIFGPREVLRD